MSARQLGCVVVTGLGLYMALEALAYTVSFLRIFQGTLPFAEIAISFVPFITMAGLGISLLVFRQPLSERLFPPAAAEELPQASEIVAALLAVMGVYLAATAFISLLSLEGLRFFADSSDGNAGSSLLDVTDAYDVATGRLRGYAQLAIGVALTLGGDRIAKLWRSRRAGPVSLE